MTGSRDHGERGRANLEHRAVAEHQVWQRCVVVVATALLAWLSRMGRLLGVCGTDGICRMRSVAQGLDASHMVAMAVRCHDVPHGKLAQGIGDGRPGGTRVNDHALTLGGIDVAVGLDGTDDIETQLVGAFVATTAAAPSPITAAAVSGVVVVMAALMVLVLARHGLGPPLHLVCALTGHDAPCVEDGRHA